MVKAVKPPKDVKPPKELLSGRVAKPPTQRKSRAKPRDDHDVVIALDPGLRNFGGCVYVRKKPNVGFKAIHVFDVKEDNQASSHGQRVDGDSLDRAMHDLLNVAKQWGDAEHTVCLIENQYCARTNAQRGTLHTETVCKHILGRYAKFNLTPTGKSKYTDLMTKFPKKLTYEQRKRMSVIYMDWWIDTPDGVKELPPPLRRKYLDYPKKDDVADSMMFALAHAGKPKREAPKLTRKERTDKGTKRVARAGKPKPKKDAPKLKRKERKDKGKKRLVTIDLS